MTSEKHVVYLVAEGLARKRVHRATRRRRGTVSTRRRKPFEAAIWTCFREGIKVFRLPSFVLVKRLVVTGIPGIWCSGCLAVLIHHAKNMRSLSTDTAPPQVDLTFVKLGETPRDEVTERLSWIDTGVAGKNFFVGRWAENNWGVAWGAASYPYMGGGFLRNLENSQCDLRFR